MESSLVTLSGNPKIFKSSNALSLTDSNDNPAIPSIRVCTVKPFNVMFFGCVIPNVESTFGDPGIELSLTHRRIGPL